MIGKIKLANNKGEVLVDSKYLIKLEKHKWYLHNGRYARGNINGKWVYMHRFLLNNSDEKDVDHINGNGLDNRVCNLRLATASLNASNKKKHKNNKSGLKGVYYDSSGKKIKRWMAQIGHNNKRKTIGRFHTKEEAGKAYDEKAKELFGEFTNGNKRETSSC